MLRISGGVLGVFCLSSSLALASGEGVYIGVNAIEANLDLQNITLNGVTYTPDNTSAIGGGLSTGYNLSSYLGIDIMIDALNRVDYSGSDAPTLNEWFSTVAVKPMLPMWKLNAFFEVGAAYVSIQQNNPNGIADTTNSEVRPFGGVGLGYNFTPNVELSFSMNRIQATNPITFGMLTLSYHAAATYGPSGFIED